jgi:adenine deaminase
MVDGELDPTAAERTEPTVLATDTVQFDPVAAAVRDR